MMIDIDEALEKSPVSRDQDPTPDMHYDRIRENPRLVFNNPDSFFGREFYHDLLMEQQEQG